MINITYTGEGQLILTQIFDKKAPGFRLHPDQKPSVEKLHKGDSMSIFPEPGVSWKMKEYPFAP